MGDVRLARPDLAGTTGSGGGEADELEAPEKKVCAVGEGPPEDDVRSKGDSGECISIAGDMMDGGSIRSVVRFYGLLDTRIV